MLVVVYVRAVLPPLLSIAAHTEHLAEDSSVVEIVKYFHVQLILEFGDAILNKNNIRFCKQYH